MQIFLSQMTSYCVISTDSGYQDANERLANVDNNKVYIFHDFLILRCYSHEVHFVRGYLRR